MVKQRNVTDDGSKRFRYPEVLYDLLYTELATQFGDGTKINLGMIERALREKKKTNRKIHVPNPQTIANIFAETLKPRQKRYIESLIRLAFNTDPLIWMQTNLPPGEGPIPYTINSISASRSQGSVLANEYFDPNSVSHWKSTYHFYQQAGAQDQWITEDVRINLEQSKLYIRSGQNPIGDNYLARGEIVHGFYLIGEWSSVGFASKSGAIDSFQAAGAFLLTLVATPKLMYGYFTGPRNTGERIYGAWILAENEQDLQRGRAFLANSTLEIIC